MVSQAQRQADQQHCGCAGACGRKDRTAGNEEIGDAVNLAIPINHATRRIIAHTGGAHMVPAATRILRPGGIVVVDQDLEPAEAGAAKLGTEYLQRAPNAVLVERAELPVEIDSWQAKR